MHQASVGFHCPECVKGGKQQVFRGPPGFDPIVTKVLLGLNVVAYLASAGSTRTDIDFGLLADGFLSDGTRIGVAQGEYVRLVSSGFLHASLLHLAFNMYALWILGPQLERVFDRPRFVLLYFVSLLGGSAGVMLLDPDALTVGASGAIFGLFGAITVIQRSLGRSIWASGLGPVLALNLFITFAIPQISIGGHLGGLVAGGAAGAIYILAIRTRQRDWVGPAAVATLGVALVFAAILFAGNPVF